MSACPHLSCQPINVSLVAILPILLSPGRLARDAQLRECLNGGVGRRKAGLQRLFGALHGKAGHGGQQLKQPVAGLRHAGGRQELFAVMVDQAGHVDDGTF